MPPRTRCFVKMSSTPRAGNQAPNGSPPAESCTFQPAPGADPTATFFNPQPNGLNAHAVFFHSGLATGCQPPCVTSGLWLSDSTSTPVLIASNHTAFPEIPSVWSFGGFETAAYNTNDQVVR